MSGATVFELAAQLGIGDLEKFLKACIANAAMMTGATEPDRHVRKIRYTVEEVADLLGVSPRWLADECRAERVEHVCLARHRFFTFDQIARMLEKHAVEPFEDRPTQPHVARVLRRIQQSRKPG
ncbi:helix-turn-helix domain-containing protein [Paractinoplanes ferrugineus]|uniref:helix-turn-helix domain-containing protein n=1 Tax=Paractinoplanes ferrugineus TaxID=113564 RepID=UPI001942333C|nr:helix-turn-helix domain-containing protein [Actinoplanes ferrugineus]